MKIAIPMINLSWHGGVRVLVQLANHLSEAGHDVQILVTRHYSNGGYRLSPGVYLRHIGVTTGIKLIDYSIFLLLLPFVLPRRSLVIANFFVTYFPSVLGACLKRGRYIYLVQDIEAKYSSPLGLLLNVVCRWTYRDRNIITVNRRLRDRLAQEFSLAVEAVDIGPAEIFYSTLRDTHSPRQYDVVFFARSEPWKGLDRLYDLLGDNPPPWRLICVSQDPILLSDLRDRGLDCVSPANDHELIKIIDDSMLLLFTSYDEGLGLPPLEAMARGVPSVLFPCGGADLYVQHEKNAIYVNDATECRLRVSQLLADKDFWSRLSAAGLLTASQFRLTVALDRIRLFIEQRRPQRGHGKRFDARS